LQRFGIGKMRCGYAKKAIGPVGIELVLIGGKSSGVVAGATCIGKFFCCGAFPYFSCYGRSNCSGWLIIFFLLL
jgi:hypothetical protein